MFKLTKSTKAYLAGFFDGEGCIYASYNRNPHPARKNASPPRYYIAATVTNTHYPILALFKAFFGGGISYKSDDSKCAHWRVSARDDLTYFLTAIQPYCIVKAEQIKIALVFLKTVQDTYTGNTPVSNPVQNLRENCYILLQKEKDKQSSLGYLRRRNNKRKYQVDKGGSKTSETAGTPERAICNQADCVMSEGSETIMEDI